MTSSPEAGSLPSYRWLIFLLVAIAGLFYVKWFPYYHRAFTAEATHSIGKSILMGRAASPPAPSLAAALDYAWAYGKAIWQAMVLGLLLGSAVQALVPVQLVARVPSRQHFGSVAAGGLLAVPGMMCTCCAASVVAGLRARNASPGGAIAFWLGNSVLSPATLVFMGFVLGWNWSALWLVLGVVMVFGLGWLANRLVTPQEARVAGDRLRLTNRAQQQAEGDNVFLRWLRVLTRMAVRLLPEYILLVLLLGATRAWLFPHIGPEVTSSVGWIVAFALAGMLFCHSDRGRSADHSGNARTWHGCRPGRGTAHDATARERAVVRDARGFFPATCARARGTAVVLLGVVAGLATVALGF